MKININTNTITPSATPNVVQSATSFNGGAPKTYTIKSEKLLESIKKAGNMSTPANRLFLGATALATQPFIDWGNKDVDHKTRKVSTARTVAKIVVGTATGMAVRTLCINWMDKFTFTPKDMQTKKVTKWSTALVPTNITHEQFASAERVLKKHRQALGSIAALGVMLFTNFLIDAPLTRICTNVFTDALNKNDKTKTDSKGGNE